MSVEIDIDQVPKERRSDERFTALRDQLNVRLLIPGELLAIAVHEAAHAVFYEAAGAAVRITGPKILYTYDGLGDYFDCYPAATQITNSNDLDIDSKRLALVMGCLAGGVATRYLTSSPDTGERGDVELFHKICNEWETTERQRKLLLRAGRETVTKALEGNVERCVEQIWSKSTTIIQTVFRRDEDSS